MGFQTRQWSDSQWACLRWRGESFQGSSPTEGSISTYQPLPLPGGSWIPKHHLERTSSASWGPASPHMPCWCQTGQMRTEAVMPAPGGSSTQAPAGGSHCSIQELKSCWSSENMVEYRTGKDSAFMLNEHKEARCYGNRQRAESMKTPW